MNYNYIRIVGELAQWPSKDEMATILCRAGLCVSVGLYSIRVKDCSHFVFQEYGGDIGPPAIDADAESLDTMLRDAELVSNALAQAGIRHRFELYDDDQKMVGYLHHGWPRADKA